MVQIDRPSLDYQAFYCEENVWRLLARQMFPAAKAWAVIVSSQSRRFVARRQKAGRPVDGLVCWDYHVFAVVDDQVGTRLALDLDSDLPFPCPLLRYLEESFLSMGRASQQPRFLVIAAMDYLTGLASDRSHMRRPDGSYIAPPPPWPAPRGEGTNTFMSWIEMSSGCPGTRYDLAQMHDFAAHGT